MASAPVQLLPVGTIVLRQSRGMRTIHLHGRILESFTKLDKLGRRQIWYRVQVLDSGITRDWPGSHCQPITPAPASA